MPSGVYERGPSRAKRKTIRTLRPDEERPGWEPYRYPDRSGYIRLRWKVGPCTYVEAREHRLVATPGTGQHVHHLNHVKDDNRPDNLRPMDPHDHGTLHAEERRAYDPALVAELYRAGWSTIGIGRHFGVSNSTIYRALVDGGVQPRSPQDAGRLHRIALDEPVVLQRHDAGEPTESIARLFGVSRTPIERILRDHGRRARRPGRPRAA